MKYYEDVLSSCKKEEYILYMRDGTVQKSGYCLKQIARQQICIAFQELLQIYEAKIMHDKVWKVSVLFGVFSFFRIAYLSFETLSTHQKLY